VLGFGVSGVGCRVGCQVTCWKPAHPAMASAHPSSASMSGTATEGFRVQGSGFGVQGSGFRVQGSGCRVQGSGFRRVRGGKVCGAGGLESPRLQPMSRRKSTRAAEMFATAARTE